MGLGTKSKSLSFIFWPLFLRPPTVPSSVHSVHPYSVSWAPLLSTGMEHVSPEGTSLSLFAWLTPIHTMYPLLQEAFIHYLGEMLLPSTPWAHQGEEETFINQAFVK